MHSDVCLLKKHPGSGFARGPPRPRRAAIRRHGGSQQWPKRHLKMPSSWAEPCCSRLGTSLANLQEPATLHLAIAARQQNRVDRGTATLAGEPGGRVAGHFQIRSPGDAPAGRAPSSHSPSHSAQLLAVGGQMSNPRARPGPRMRARWQVNMRQEHIDSTPLGVSSAFPEGCGVGLSAAPAWGRAVSNPWPRYPGWWLAVRD